MKKIPIECRTKKEFNALEKILKSRDTNTFSLDQIKKIIEAYEDYKGNAFKASRELSQDIHTILKCWRKVEFKIRKRGREEGSRDEKKYQKIKHLIKLRYYSSEIASELGISRQAVSEYFHRHPELKENLVNGIYQSPVKVYLDKFYKKIKILTSKDKSITEISRIIKVPRSSLGKYFDYHPKLRKDLVNGRYKNPGRPKR